MSHSISARKVEGFKVEVLDWNGKVTHSAWYQDRAEAQSAAEYHERLVTLPVIDDVFSRMSDDELLAELMK